MKSQNHLDWKKTFTSEEQKNKKYKWDIRILDDGLDFYHLNTKKRRDHVLLYFNICTYRFWPYTSTRMSSSMMVERREVFCPWYFSLKTSVITEWNVFDATM